MYKSKKIALVVPAYNEERLIKPTLENAPKTIDKIYVIDDASTDYTDNMVKRCGENDKRIKLIKHDKNKGVGQAIITGYQEASKNNMDIVVVVGGDNQMDLDDLPNFIDPIVKDEADYVKGNRFLLGGNAFFDMPKKRFLGNTMLSLITKFASGYWRIFDTQDGYTAITKEAIDKIDWKLAWKKYGYVGDWLVLFNVYNLRVKDVPRKAIYLKGERQSQIKIGRYVITVFPRMINRFFWRMKIKYFYQEFHPLLLFYISGTLFSITGLLMGIWIIYGTLVSTLSTNWVILCSLLLITGIQLTLFAIFFDMQNNDRLQNIEK